MTTIKHNETLIYYDGVELFLAEDELNTQYLCLHYESIDLDKYLCAPISKKRINQFYNGEIDLRSIYESPESNRLFTLTTDGLIEDIYELSLTSIDKIPEKALPAPGFYFQKSVVEEIIVNEATEKNRAVIHLSLNPPESKEEPKIDTAKLIGFLKLFQNTLKYSYKKSLSTLNANLRVSLDKKDYFETEVFSFSPGSFTIHLQSKTTADFLGYVELVKALEKFDEITSVIKNPDETLEILLKNKGHLVNSYKKLLNLIIENDTPLNYSWTYPEINTLKKYYIKKQDAIPIVELMNQKEELEIETIEIIGRLIKADVNHGNWTLKSEENGKEYRGRIFPSSQLSLSGLILESQIYKFVCEEKIEHEKVSGREIITFWLQSFNKMP